MTRIGGRMGYAVHPWRLGLRHAATAVFVGWAIVAAVTAWQRPGQLLVVALVGVVGATYFEAATGPLRTNAERAVGLVCAAVPLANTWPAQMWGKAVFAVLPAAPWALANLASLALIATAWALVPRRDRRVVVVGIAAALVCVGGLAAALDSVAPSLSVRALWVTIVVPAAVGVAVAGRRWRTEVIWVCLRLVTVAALVPVLLGLFAYVLEFGVPSSSADLMSAKLALYRPFLIQDVTFGNLGHTTDFLVMLLPLALALAAAAPQRRDRRLGLFASVAFALLVALTLERSAVVLAFGTAVCAGVLGLSIARARAGWAGLVVALLLGVAIAGQPVRGYFLDLLPAHSAPAVTVPPPDPAPGTKPSFEPPVSAELVGSTDVRAGAVRRGWDVAEDHFPLGVGPGLYARYDPIHRATHTLPLQALVETGLIGAIGLILSASLAFYLLAILLARMVRGARTAAALVALAGASVLFLVEGTLGGTFFGAGPLNIWGTVYWIGLGFAAAAVDESATT